MWKIILTVSVAALGIFIYQWNEMPSETQQWATSMADASEENREKLTMMNKSAFILGYTGETGKALVNELLESKVFSRVVLMGRRQVDYEDEAHKQLEQKIIDFENLEQESFSGFDVGFCCLGTTRGKSGKDGFYKVDHDYVVNSAKAAKDAGCSDFHLVSSAGANNSSLFLYTKTKGQVEEELKAMGFDRLSIYRPAVLMCNRTEHRTMESAVRFLMKPLQAAAPTWATIPTTVVAKALVTVAASPSKEASQTFDNKAIHLLAGYGKQSGKAKKEEVKDDKN